MAKKKSKAKKNANLIFRLKSTAKTGHFYSVYAKKGTNLQLKKYDPVLRQRILYKQTTSK